MAFNIGLVAGAVNRSLEEMFADRVSKYLQMEESRRRDENLRFNMKTAEENSSRQKRIDEENAEKRKWEQARQRIQDRFAYGGLEAGTDITDDVRFNEDLDTAGLGFLRTKKSEQTLPSKQLNFAPTGNKGPDGMPQMLMTGATEMPAQDIPGTERTLFKGTASQQAEQTRKNNLQKLLNDPETPDAVKTYIQTTLSTGLELPAGLLEPKKQNFQRETVLVGGKPTLVGYDSSANRYFAAGPDGAPVDVTTQVRPLPTKGSKGSSGSGGTGAGSTDLPMIDAIMDNPGLFDRLTAKQKEEYTPALRARGFTGFEAPLSETAKNTIAEGNAALALVADLKTTLEKGTGKGIVKKSDNPDMGPLDGLWSHIPGSNAQKLNAKIASVRQQVGKYMEGGVLRKEDEEKYAKMLPTIYDDETTALAKLEYVTAQLQQKQQAFIAEQTRGGRRTNSSPSTESRVLTELPKNPQMGDRFNGYRYDGFGWVRDPTQR